MDYGVPRSEQNVIEREDDVFANASRSVLPSF